MAPSRLGVLEISVTRASLRGQRPRAAPPQEGRLHFLPISSMLPYKLDSSFKGTFHHPTVFFLLPRDPVSRVELLVTNHHSTNDGLNQKFNE